MKQITPHRKVDYFYPLLFLSGLFGYCQGMFGRASWQDAIEGAQVLAGVVHYPVATPYSEYLFKAWTLLHQIPAVFLKLGFSEISLAWCLSGIIGMVSYQVLTLAYYRLSGQFLFALTIPFFIDYTHFYADGSVYPVYLMGNSATYGAIGLSYVWLALLCLCFRKWRLGGFLLGLSVAVHASLAAIAMSIAFITLLITKEIRKILWPFLIGVLIAGLSYYVQQRYFSGIKSAHTFNASELKEFILRWDWHRMPVPWNDSGVLINFLAAGIAGCFLTVKRLAVFESRSFFIVTLIFSGIALTGVAISHVPIKFVPILLIRLMLGRLLNFNILMFGVLVLGILHRLNTKLSRIAMSFILIGTVIASRLFLIFNIGFILFLAIITFGAILFYKPQEKVSGKKLSGGVIHNGVILIILIFLAAKNLIFSFNSLNHCQKTFNEDWRKDNFSRTISEGNGLLLIAPPLGGFQMITRRPILFDPGSIDMIPYFPEIGPNLREMILTIDGVDILSYPLSKIQDHELPADDIKLLWEKRSLEEWQALKRRYAIRNILTPDWKLQLPLITKNDRNRYYEIP